MMLGIRLAVWNTQLSIQRFELTSRMKGQRVAKHAHEHKPLLSFEDFSTKNMSIIPNNAFVSSPSILHALHILISMKHRSSSLYIPFVNANTFSDYSPMVFYFLRRKYGIDEREYLVS